MRALDRAPYVLYGVQQIDPVSPARFSGQHLRHRHPKDLLDVVRHALFVYLIICLSFFILSSRRRASRFVCLLLVKQTHKQTSLHFYQMV